MCQESPLEALAARICSSAKTISAYCEETNYPHRSFDRDAPSTMLPRTAPQHILVAQQTVLEAAYKIQQLATDASDYLGRQAVQFQQLSCLRWLCHFRILSHIPLHGSVPYSEVAAAAGVPESQLKSIARMAMTSSLLSEPIPGEIAHNATSALFVANPNLFDWALFMTEASAPTAAKFAEATEKWGATDVKNQTAYNIAMATDLPFFDHIAKSPEMTKQFAGYMKNVTTSEGTSVKHLLNGFDWASLGEATIVDVGGSSGHASIALANTFPNLQFIVQDLADTLSSSKTNLASLPPAVASRITFQGHDFFSPQPIKDADVYLLRMIIHDWPAAEASLILKHLVAAIKPGARIVIMDTVLPTPGSVPTTQEAMLRVRDLTMMQAFNSHERELDDWTKLLATTEPKLGLKGVVQPFGSVMSVMEVVPIIEQAGREDAKVNAVEKTSAEIVSAPVAVGAI
ncbi:hypothetical protein MMC16_005987 [Acarospora aff. strigata]|nr:hypothetical protein [Acarospora aff. strigata]